MHLIFSFIDICGKLPLDTLIKSNVSLICKMQTVGRKIFLINNMFILCNLSTVKTFFQYICLYDFKYEIR